MPKVNGFEATRQIMETCPTPIVIVSGSYQPDEVATNFEALEAGALAVTARPKGLGNCDHDASAIELIRTVKLMSEVKVVKRWLRQKPLSKINSSSGPIKLISSPREVQVVAIGASTGGPMILQTILSLLPKSFSAPILIVQHMTPGFTEGFIEWLGHSTGFPVQKATNGDSPLPGHAYVAPDNFQMGLGYDHRIFLRAGERENGMCPSVSYLFRSVHAAYGSKALGVLLTGMGTDGVAELKQLREVGAITIAQDKESSVVHGMPGAAIQIDAATHVLSPDGIAKALKTIVTKE
jgi:two-component system chemotaxis response regulator CheB